MAEDDAKIRELKKKVGGLVQNSFGGNLQKAFEHYAALREHGPRVDRKELRTLLEDAGVGNYSTRGAWVDFVMYKLDKDLDGAICWEEFDSVINLRKP